MTLTTATLPSVDLQTPVVVTIGVFDGVHRGHQRVLARAREIADRHSARLIAMTFEPHPAQLLAPGRAPALLSTMEFRARLLKKHGADDVVVTAFDEALSKKSPEQFVDEVVLSLGRVVAIVVGENFRFGHRAVGDVTTLQELGRGRGFVAEGMELVGDPELAWSSTRIRSLVVAGHVDAAREILGRPHRVEGVVGHGDKRGRELGYPTANLMVPAGVAVPADGVYSGFLVVDPYGDAVRYRSAISIGTNPQFAGTERRVEAYAIHEAGLDLYDRDVAIDFIARLREQMVFDSVEALLEQMARDVNTALAQLGE